jgi:hypothetical protein
MLGLTMFYFFSSKQGRERTCLLTPENPEFRIESRSCIESITLRLVRVVDTATTPRQPKKGRRWWWKNSPDRQIKRQKNAVSFFFGLCL